MKSKTPPPQSILTTTMVGKFEQTNPRFDNVRQHEGRFAETILRFDNQERDSVRTDACFWGKL